MVIIQSKYNSINKPKMTTSFLLHLNHIKEIYDVDKGVIGLKFHHSFSDREYEIELESGYKNMLASELLNLLIEAHASQIYQPSIISGNIKLM